MASASNLNSPIGQIIAAKQSRRRLVGRKRRPIKLPRPPRQQTPKRAERIYRRNLLRIMDRAGQIVSELMVSRLNELAADTLVLDSARVDVEDWPSKIKRIAEQLRLRFEDEKKTITQAAEEMGAQVSAENTAQIAKQTKAITGVDVLAGDAALATTLQASLAENVSLITTLTGDYFSKVEDTVLRGFRSGQRATEISKGISGLITKGKKHAEFIARDQVLKLNGSLTRNRQSDLGLYSYIWRTSLDERVRPDHARLEGEVFDWKGPGPITDSRTGARNHPGMDFNCRCTAEPNIAPLLGEDEVVE